MADWLKQHGIEDVVMQSTGVYWIPVYEILERAGFRVCLTNARDTKTYRDARQMYKNVNGCGSCIPTGCCGTRFGRRRKFVECGRSGVCATGW